MILFFLSVAWIWVLVGIITDVSAGTTFLFDLFDHARFVKRLPSGSGAPGV